MDENKHLEPQPTFSDFFLNQSHLRKIVQTKQDSYFVYLDGKRTNFRLHIGGMEFSSFLK
jgi:hypothetical protein